MKKKILILFFISLLFSYFNLLAGFEHLASGNPGENTPPNVLFLIADDLAMQMGCYGDDVAKTPSIDQLASEGVLFERAYACGTVCTPSRKSFMTGLSVKTIEWGNYNYLMHHPETMTLPWWFRENGYHTAKVGKIAHTDDFEGPHDWDINLNKTKIPVGKPQETFKYGSSAVDGDFVMRARKYEDGVNTLDQARTEAFERFIVEEWDRSKPFFFALGFHTPHQPSDANYRHFDQHPANRMKLTTPPEGATPMTKPFPENFRWWSVDFPADGQRQAIKGYYASVTMMDEMIGRALTFLEKEGLMENTIIVFTSDHGYNLGYRNIWAKHVLYPSVLHVPLIVKYPDMPNKGTRAKGIVELLDIFPTLADLAGLPVPDELDGVSFIPLIMNPSREGKEAAYAQGILHRGSGMAVTTDEGTYMEWDNGEYQEFYDLTTDPMAWFNKIDSPEFSEDIKYHQELLYEYFDK